MPSDRWEMLEARVIKLEKQNRLLRAGCLTAGLLVVCGLTLGQSKAGNTVEAQRFVLKSANGEVRAELSTLNGDFPRFSLRSPNGEKETELNPLGISVMDHGLSGKLPLAHFGNTGLYFTDSQGRTVMELGGASISSPQLTPVPDISIFNETGHAVWHVPDQHAASSAFSQVKLNLADFDDGCESEQNRAAALALAEKQPAMTYMSGAAMNCTERLKKIVDEIVETLETRH